MKNTITLFLMTQKGHATLCAIAGQFQGAIDAVIASRDAGLQKDYYEEIKELCSKHGIPFHDRADHHGIASEYAIAVGWRWLIDARPGRLIVLHDSLLPKYRGFNPLVSALINGESKIGVTALFGSDEYDKGDIIARSVTEIGYPIKIQDAIDLLIPNYRKLAVKIVRTIAGGGAIQALKQNEEEASYSLWRDEDDYRIDWSQSSEAIKRFIDAVGYPYAGALTDVNNEAARILDAEVIGDVHIENRAPGKVIFIKDEKPVVVCGAGLLKINELIDDATKKSVLPLKKFRSRFM
ncbi:MAG TPA: methionyl-tRNA formyltransferase [Sedimenticola sp.]|nr:methionyl-tRNA formyltransferase [Sedimenticola sp.]